MFTLASSEPRLRFLRLTDRTDRSYPGSTVIYISAMPTELLHAFVPTTKWVMSEGWPTIDTGLIKPDEKVGASRKYARYLPFWA
jgi:hypothetical protein